MNELPKIEARIHASEERAAAALDEMAADMLDLNRNRAGVERDLHEVTDDVPIRLRLTGLADQYNQLPRAIPDPLARLVAMGEAARRRAEKR